MTLTNRRAEQFDRALTTRNAPDPAMAALVAVAGALAAVPQPTAAFRDGLRTQLMAEAGRLAAAAAAAPAAAIPAAAAPAALSPLQTLAKVLAKPAMQVATGGLAATVAAAGVGAGAQRSLPGDALYGLKQAIAGLGAPDDAGSTLDGTTDRVEEIVALLERDGAAAVGQVERIIDGLKAELDAATADLLAQARAGSRAAYEELKAKVGELSNVLQALRGQLPAAAQDDLDAAMSTLNSARAQLAALPVPGGPLPTGVPGGPTTAPPGGTKSPKPTETRPSSPPASQPTTTSPSTKPVETPTMTTPPTDLPPLPTVEPTLPVTLPPLVP